MTPFEAYRIEQRIRSGFETAMPPPVSKVIPGTGFLVDGFKFANPSIRGYFLSHAHSDHYTGLSELWNQGPIYCSKVTARLIAHMLCVDEKYLKVLPMNQPQNVDGVEVILVDANHCPGAVQFLFRLPDGRKFVHCGDMRFSTEMLGSPFLQRFRGADAIFLDTTYCNPKHTFPIQDESIKYVADTIERYMKEQKEGGPSCLFMISTYGIGKERILLEVHSRCDTQIYVAERKLGVMGCLDWEHPLESIFTANAQASNVHVVKWGFLGETWPYFRPNFVNMESTRVESGADKVIGFVPTGWVHTKQSNEFPIRKKGACEVHLVPYSEHSSYSELREFVKQMKPEKIIPTVGVNGDDVEKKEASILKHFRNLVNETASKAKFIENMQRGSFQLYSQNDIQEASTDLMLAQPEISVAGSAKDNVGSPVAQRWEEMKDSGQTVGDDMRTDLTQDADSRANRDDANAGGCGEALEMGFADTQCEPPDQIQCTIKDDIGNLIVSKLGGDPMFRSEEDQGNGKVVLEGGIEAGSRDACSEKDIVGAVGLCSIVGNTAETDVQEMSVTDCNENNTREVECLVDRSRQVEGVPGSAQRRIESKAVEEDVQQNESHAVDGSEEHGGHKDRIAQIVAILSGMVTSAQADSLLREAGGIVEVAINAFYEKKEIKAPMIDEKLTHLTSSQMTGSKRPLPKKTSRRTPRKRSRMPAGQRSIRSYFAPKNLSLRSDNSVEDASGLKGGKKLGEDVQILEPQEEQAIDSDISKHVHEEIGQSTRNPPCVNEEHGAHLSQADLEDLLHGLDSCVEQTPRPQEHIPLHDIMRSDAILPAPEAPRPIRQIQTPTEVDFLSTKMEVKDHDIPPPSNAEKRCEQGVEETVLSPVWRYDPVSSACWGRGEPLPYLHLARALHEVASTTKRLKITDGLTNMFRSVLALSPENLLETVYLTCGKITPEHVGGELNVGSNIVSLAIIEATGCSRGKLRELYSEKGDLGDVAQACKQSQQLLVTPAPLTIPGVFRSLKQLSLEQGAGATDRRKKIVTAMLRACREIEIRYLVRTLIQNLRIGASWLTVVGALGRAVLVHNEGECVSKERLDKAAADVCELYHLCPSFDALVPALVEGGVNLAKQRCTLVPGVPVKPMLAKISAGICDALTTVKESAFLAEFKYDGVRAQIHICDGGQVSIFSRRCETKTEAYPDVVAAIKSCVGSNVHSIILDAELVAVDRAKGNRLKAFQELSHRRRAAVDESDVTISVCVFVFDILYLNGEVMLKRSLRERKVAMDGALTNLAEGFVAIASSVEMNVLPPKQTGCIGKDGVSTLEKPNEVAEIEKIESQVREFLLSALSAGAEGLMLKILDGTSAGYESSKRSDHWLKIKSDYCDGLHDSLDVVPIGAWRGQGRKVRWYSPFLLAVWDPVNEEFQSICRCMSGFSDAFYEEATARLSRKVIDGPKSYYRTQEQPSTWFEPCEVWEIKGADLTISPVHQAALGRVHESKGCGLRFPRFVKVREDKEPMEATTPDMIERLFLKQSRRLDCKGEPGNCSDKDE